ncbi:hypothetical protein ACEN2J_14835 [Pseudorhodobacter sp. W20_MBD10_FR17]
MPNKDTAVAMARYDLWQNETLITAAGAKSGDTDLAIMLAKFKAM